MLQWDHKFDVGVERIDAQHHSFLGLIAEFQAARLAGESLDELDGILNEIVLYAKYHFYSESSVMRRARYPELDAHQYQHFELINDLGNKITGLHLGLNQAADIERFLIEWFTGHTTTEDAKFGRYFSTLGADRSRLNGVIAVRNDDREAHRSIV